MATLSIFILLSATVVTPTRHIAYIVKFLFYFMTVSISDFMASNFVECLPNYDLDGIWKEAVPLSNDICLG
jgi:hypothetical protein